MQIPFVRFQPVKTSEHMAAAGVFGLLQVNKFRVLSFKPLFRIEICAIFQMTLKYNVAALFQVIAALKYIQYRLSKKEFVTLFFGGIALAFVLGISTIVLLTYTGEFKFKFSTILSLIYLCF